MTQASLPRSAAPPPSHDGRHAACAGHAAGTIAGKTLKLVPVNADTSTQQAVVAPDEAAPVAVDLDQFLAAIGARAFRFAELGLRHRDDALDAVQDAMMKMLAYRERPAREWTPLFWSILRSRIVDVQRRRTFRLGWLSNAGAMEDVGIDWADPGPDPARTHDGREAYAQLADALRGLPRRQREAFTLRILEELDVATTAQAMGCSEGSVKTHLSRARDALQKRLEDYA
jgi:RNA polymerase sigma-70 factor (ECF subfamily)